MSNSEMQNESVPLTKEDYNQIPVYYCKHCGSLAIRAVPGFLNDYCDKCGSTDIGKASIEGWQLLQETTFKSTLPDKPKKVINIFR